MRISTWLPYDNIDDYTFQEVSKLLKTFLYIIPIVAVILATVNFSLGLTTIALTILTVPVFCLFSFIALARGMINLSMIILMSILIAATTLSCTLGNGVHETGIIVLPVIVLFSSLVMNVRGVILTAIIVILCLAYIVFGEQYGLYPSRGVAAVRWVDLVVVQTITIIHIFVTYTFSNITRKNLERVKEELHNQEIYKSQIAEHLEAKSELLRLVHHRVKNNLLLINSLIELESHGRPDAKDNLSEITNSIHTIARAHDPLYHSDDYKEVSLKPYLDKLIATYVQASGLEKITIDLVDLSIYHEKALLLGIVLQKTLSNLSQNSSPDLTVKLSQKQKSLFLVVQSENTQSLKESDSSLIEMLSKKLGGELKITANEVSLKFEYHA
ncbi:histidine kinase dimerization/phosphoacceptor domain -containing protein [Ekhidna sp.]|uniref:sensor histidine kinase n=1 Tax=Ekhidna sp. TaxID=2608089 RepID=UPI00329A0BAE